MPAAWNTGSPVTPPTARRCFTTSAWQDSPEYIDTGLDPETTYSYTVQARDKASTPNEGAPSTPVASATTDPTLAGPGGAVIYDSFDYAAGSVSGGSGGTGFTGNWATRNAAPEVVTTGLDWGTLSVAGKSVTDVTGGSAYRDIGASSVLDNAGLMANGGTLWFSVLLNVAGTNRTNVDFNFALGSDGFHTYVAGRGHVWRTDEPGNWRGDRVCPHKPQYDSDGCRECLLAE